MNAIIQGVPQRMASGDIALGEKIRNWSGKEKF